MEVFVLHHTRQLADGNEDVKLLGVYSSEIAARTARARSSRLPGFRDHPNGFHVDRYVLDTDHWTEGFTTIDAEGNDE